MRATARSVSTLDVTEEVVNSMPGTTAVATARAAAEASTRLRNRMPHLGIAAGQTVSRRRDNPPDTELSSFDLAGPKDADGLGELPGLPWADGPGVPPRAAPYAWLTTNACS